uniref:glucan endo-1,3-beta-D-glucosidase n=1 Tax=Aegilops tauschii TaxID=37682 RepID=M8B4T4_AEGTA
MPLRDGCRRQLQRARGLCLAAALCVLALALVSDASPTPVSLLGINYGRVGNNLPPPQAALPLLQGLGIARVRLYDPEPGVLRAFAKTGIELYVGVPDQCLAAVAEPAGATSWLKDSILRYLPDTKIVALTVGNEVLTGNDTALTRNLLPAMESLHGALAAANLDKQIAVTTAHNLGVLGTSYPPSAGAFRKDLLQYLCPILDFHAKTGSPFLVNAYPYFAYSDDPKGIHLDYALLEPSNPGVPDANTGLHYPNLLVAQVDAAYHAISAANSAAARVVEIRISETGWPSAGDANEKAATPESAARYNSNVMRLVAEWKGTPLKPNVPLRVYVFALFNENMKPGPASERNYGLFKPDSTPVYPLTYKPAHGDFTPGGNSTGGDNDYYDISAASREPTGFVCGKGMTLWVIASFLAAFAHSRVHMPVGGGHGRKLLWQEVLLPPSWLQPEVPRSSWGVMKSHAAPFFGSAMLGLFGTHINRTFDMEWEVLVDGYIGGLYFK